MRLESGEKLVDVTLRGGVNDLQVHLSALPPGHWGKKGEECTDCRIGCQTTGLATRVERGRAGSAKMPPCIAFVASRYEVPSNAAATAHTAPTA